MFLALSDKCVFYVQFIHIICALLEL